MKKLLFLILLFSGLSNGHGQKASVPEYKAGEETTYWNFLKERIFNGKNSNFYRYYDTINIQLINSRNPEDSAIITRFIPELEQLIPNKIYFSGKTAGNLIIEIVPPKSGIKYASHPTLRMIPNRFHYISKQHHKLNLPDSLSYKARKKIIEYYLVRSLCFLQDQSYHTFIGNAIFDDKNNTAPLSTRFTKADKFLLLKLYSPNFITQFKRYITHRYSWWYYINFVYRDQVQLMRLFIYVVYYLFIILISYKTIITRKFRYKYLNYLYNALLIALVFTGHSFLEQLLYIPTDSSIKTPPRLYGSISFIFGLIAVFIATFLYFLEKYLIPPSYTPLHKILLKTFYFLLILIIFATLVIYASYDFNTREVLEGDKLIILFALILVIVLSRGVFLYFKEHSDALLREKDMELSKLRELKAEAEVASLHARIHPHFLYNSLNSIAGLAHSDPEKTEKMALSLSDLFRYNINRKNEATTTIDDEIKTVRAYLEIEQIRFGKRMEFSIEVNRELHSVRIPRNIIQPLVENAIKHGISNIQGKGVIQLFILKQSHGGITISVKDNGPGFPEGTVSGYGLQSIYDILELTYGKEAQLDYRNTPDKCIWIHISKRGVQHKLKK